MKTEVIKKVSAIGIQFLIFAGLSLNAQDLKDHDGNVYKTVNHGIQVWTAGNLNVSHFRNGEAIPQAKTPEEWVNAGAAGKPAWCFYENDPENGNKYGKLYNWYSINDPRGLAPKGWHIPANSDWQILVKNLFGVDIAGTKLKSTTGWKSKAGTNDIGFTALPSGYRDQEGKFKELGTTCIYWSNSVPVEVRPSNQIYSLELSNNSIEIKYLKSDKAAGFSVRCEKD